MIGKSSSHALTAGPAVGREFLITLGLSLSFLFDGSPVYRSAIKYSNEKMQSTKTIEGGRQRLKVRFTSMQMVQSRSRALKLFAKLLSEHLSSQCDGILKKV